MKTLLERFLEKVGESDNCWVWQAAMGGGGKGEYGVMWNGVRMTYAHRISYEFFKGKIPDGLQIDHLCRNRKCVNPTHLEAVTQKENLNRGEGISAKNFRKTHCKRGHEFTPENIYISTHGFRQCRTCKDWHNSNTLKTLREATIKRRSLPKN